ncbi:50S ribosomal protein L30 [Porticoccus sp.]
MTNVKKIKVTLLRSIHGRLASHKACVAGLGLRRINHTVEVEDTPSVRGMINKVHYMVKVEGE